MKKSLTSSIDFMHYPHADTQQVFPSKLLYEHSRDILDKDWKMEFIRSRNNQAERNPCITDHLFNLRIMMSNNGILSKAHSFIIP